MEVAVTSIGFASQYNEVVKTYLAIKKRLTKFVLQNINISKSTLMYTVLDIDIIKSEIVPYLPLAKRGFQVKVPLEGIVNAIFYKLKTGVQWYQLPVKAMFDSELLCWQSVYYHYRK